MAKRSYLKTCSCGELHSRNQDGFYVSVVDGPKIGLLLGPFKKHSDALNQIETVREKAYILNPMSWFYSFGTVRMKSSYRKSGTLNDYFPHIASQLCKK